jgi:pimeloyl-ACP methyl ester carboxylesterase
MDVGRLKSPQAMNATLIATRAAAKVSTRLAGLLAARLWFTPWTVPLGDRAKAHQDSWLADTTSIQFATSAGKVAGFVAGAGPTVLLVHGWGERSGDMGAFIEPLTSSGYRAVGIDLPAHGKSPGTQTNLIVAADAIGEVAREMDVRAIVAHSMGGHAAMTAMSRGLSPEAVVLLAPAVRLSGALKRFGYLFGLPPRAITGLREAIERRFGAEVWDDLAADGMARAFTTPSLIFHDHEDPQIDPADSELLADAWPAATLKKTTGLGHGKIVRDAVVIRGALQFIRSYVSAENISPDLEPERDLAEVSTAG